MEVSKNNRIFIFIFIMILGITMNAQNHLKIKFDDGGIVEWRISEKFKTDVITREDGTYLRLTGHHSVILLPVDYTEWTFRDNDDRVIVQGEWYDWGFGNDYYTLEENGNNVILGNLPENTAIDAFIGEDETTCRYLTVSDKLVIDPTDGYNIYCFKCVGFEILPC